jgi:hypothetical protein
VAYRSLRDDLVSSIGFAISRSRDLMRRLLKEHVSDDTRDQLARRVVEHLELTGFEIDEQERIIRKKDGGRGWQ